MNNQNFYIKNIIFNVKDNVVNFLKNFNFLPKKPTSNRADISSIKKELNFIIENLEKFGKEANSQNRDYIVNFKKLAEFKDIIRQFPQLKSLSIEDFCVKLLNLNNSLEYQNRQAVAESPSNLSFLIFLFDQALEITYEILVLYENKLNTDLIIKALTNHRYLVESLYLQRQSLIRYLSYLENNFSSTIKNGKTNNQNLLDMFPNFYLDWKFTVEDFYYNVSSKINNLIFLNYEEKFDQEKKLISVNCDVKFNDKKIKLNIYYPLDVSGDEILNNLVLFTNQQFENNKILKTLYIGNEIEGDGYRVFCINKEDEEKIKPFAYKPKDFFQNVKLEF